jgi:hypothetical protein
MTRAGATTPEDEARLLAARLRRGELSPERLDVLVYVGHGAACQVQDVEAPLALNQLRDWIRKGELGRHRPALLVRAAKRLQRWGRGLAPLGHEVAARALAAPIFRCLEQRYRDRWDDLVAFDHLGVSTVSVNLDPDEVSRGLEAALDAGGQAAEDWISDVLEGVTDARVGAPRVGTLAVEAGISAGPLEWVSAWADDDSGFSAACDLLARLAGLLDHLTLRPPGSHEGGHSQVRCRRDLEEGLVLGAYALGSFADLLSAVTDDLTLWALR